jgi:hypothetical protein
MDYQFDFNLVKWQGRAGITQTKANEWVCVVCVMYLTAGGEIRTSFIFESFYRINSRCFVGMN